MSKLIKVIMLATALMPVVKSYSTAEDIINLSCQQAGVASLDGLPIEKFGPVMQNMLEIFEQPKEYRAPLKDFTDALTIILTRVSQDLNPQLIAHAEKFLNDKGKAKNRAELLAPHPLANKIIIETVDLMLKTIHERKSEILLYVTAEDLNVVTTKLKSVQKTKLRLEQRGKGAIGMLDLVKEISAISAELEPIWAKVAEQIRIEDQTTAKRSMLGKLGGAVTGTINGAANSATQTAAIIKYLAYTLYPAIDARTKINV